MTLHTIMMCLSPFKYWFINCYISLMLLAPYVIIATKNMSNKTFDMLVLNLTIINVLFGRFIGTGDGFSLIWFLNLFLIGHRLKRISIQYSLKKIFMLLVASIAMQVTISFLALNRVENVDLYNVGIVGVYSNFFCLITSVCLFLLFKQSVLPINSQKVSAIALSAFAVYLISENFIIKPEIWKLWNNLLAVTNSSSYLIVFISVQIVFCSLLFFICFIIDRIRLCVFEIFHVNSLIKRLDEQTIRLLDCIVNKMRKDETA